MKEPWHGVMVCRSCPCSRKASKNGWLSIGMGTPPRRPPRDAYEKWVEEGTFRLSSRVGRRMGNRRTCFSAIAVAPKLPPQPSSDSSRIWVQPCWTGMRISSWAARFWREIQEAARVHHGRHLSLHPRRSPSGSTSNPALLTSTMKKLRSGPLEIMWYLRLVFSPVRKARTVCSSSVAGMRRCQLISAVTSMRRFRTDRRRPQDIEPVKEPIRRFLQSAL